MDRYSISIASVTPNQSTAPTYTELGPVVASGLSWMTELSREGSATASCDPSTLDDSILDAVAEALDDDSDVPWLELWIHRDDTRVHRGPIVGLSVSGTGETWTFNSRGPLYGLRYMYVLAEVVHSGDDQHDIAVGLIDQFQDEDYGHRGIDTTQVTASGTTRDRTYPIGDPVFERLIELAEVTNGFDVWLDDLELNLGSKGSDLTETVVLDRRGIVDAGLSISFAAGDLASEALALNTDEDPLTSTSEDTTLRNSFGKTGVVGSFDGVTQQGTLDDHASGLQAARSRPFISPQPKLLPVSGAGVLDFSTGDTIEFSPRIGVDLTLERRVQVKSVSVSDVGEEEIGVQFL